MFNMLVLAGPPKVEGVMFGNNIVRNGRIHQEIKWNLPVLRYNKFPKYIIRYAESRRDRSEQSSVPNTTLQLNFSTSNITYYIRVAVKSAGDQKRGDFSDPVSITYTSEFTHAGIAVETHSSRSTHTVCYTHPLVLHYSSWSTSRPDTCQQNLSQHHIPVVPT